MGGKTRSSSFGRELDALVSELVQIHRRIAAAQAGETRLLATAVELMLDHAAGVRERPDRPKSSADLPLREIAAEIAAALRVSDRTVQRRMGEAASLVAEYPAVYGAWRQGRVDAGHVAAILDGGAGLSHDNRTRYERVVLAVAERESAGRLRGMAREIAARIDPDGGSERIRQRQSERFVRVADLGDGLSRLLADLPTPLAYAIYDRLTRTATTIVPGDERTVPDERPTDDERPRHDERSTHGDRTRHDESATHGERTVPASTVPGERTTPVSSAFSDGDILGADGAETAAVAPEDGSETVMTGPSPGARPRRGGGDDPRTMDQRRADILADMLLAGAPVAHGTGLASVRGHVQIMMPVLALAGTSRAPAVVPGHGPVDADLAIRLVGNAPGWDRVMTDPYNGAVLATDRYRVPADLTRLLRARDERCRFPGCGRVAAGCDVDHTHDAVLGGKTSADNLAHLCRRHHTLKHQTAWQVRQVGGGVLEWTAPSGRCHDDRPPGTVRFVPDENDENPPPF